MTGGISDPIDITSSSDPVWALESAKGGALITTEIEGPRLEYDFAVRELGWHLVTTPWFEPAAMLEAASDFCSTPLDELLSDSSAVGRSVTDELIASRMVLSVPEQDALRSLGELVARALRTGVDSWRPGETTDCDIAATIAACLVREGAVPVCLIVGGDERLRHVRHPLAVGDVIHDALMVVVVARRGGLHAAATRIAVVRDDDPIIDLVRRLEPVHSAVLDAANAGATWGDATDTLAGAYAAIGHDGAWREHFQGGPIAFEQREFELAPGQRTSPFWDMTCVPGTAVAWNPSLRGGAKIEETYLVTDTGLELLTGDSGWMTSGRWPHSVVRVVD